MKVITWNVNGIRTSIKALQSCLAEHKPDILCLQETKVVDEKVKEWLEGLRGHYPYQQSYVAHKQGYSGTLCLSKEKAYAYQEGFGIEELDQEGRLQVFQYLDFFLVNAYLPSINERSSLERQSYRIRWDDALLDMVTSLQRQGEVLVCGDLNAACQQEDMSHTHQRHEGLKSGFMREDDQTLMSLQDLGLVDTFRKKYPKETGVYTWWSNKNGKRESNQGCRLDYILASSELVSKIEKADIYTHISGSDHCPISVELSL